MIGGEAVRREHGRGEGPDDGPEYGRDAEEGGNSAAPAESSVSVSEITAELRSGPLEQLPARLCAACVRVLPVAGASISVLGGSGARVTLSASDESAARLAEIQYSLGEGLCRQAIELRAPVSASDLTQGRDVHRWPLFARQAVAAGADCVFSIPLDMAGSVMGTLDLYGASPRALPGDAMRLALRAGDAVALALSVSHLRQPDAADPGPAWVTEPEAGHEEVFKATGMLMVRLGVDADTAMARLRGRAFALDRTVTEVARDVIDRTDDFGIR
ncbi:GAF and ANTAR domain-containing protein [Streptomyces sp. HNM0575]|uniref:GAF domain-containing protein n=1 Tax=Streptomyces sp. HNM0575 TaxID=2716338 RepID=UPI00145D4152|nr:GAF and ANTAR domain-containing protein [Streptomyces sp. HNM0575]